LVYSFTSSKFPSFSKFISFPKANFHHFGDFFI
jgi:hypothetical protein